MLAHEEVIQLAASILDLGPEDIEHVTPLPGAENVLFRLLARGEWLVMRLSPVTRRTEADLRGELDWLHLLAAAGVDVVRPVSVAPSPVVTLADGTQVRAVLFEALDGAPPPPGSVDPALLVRWGELIGAIHASSGHLAQASGPHRPRWTHAANYDADRLVDLPATRRDAAHAVIRRADEEGAELALVHGDLGLANLLAVGDRLVAIDFDDSCWAPPLYDLASTLYDLLVDWGSQATIQPLDAASALVAGYRRRVSDPPAPPHLAERLWAALVVERAITDRRLGTAPTRSDRHLWRLLDDGRLPEPLESIRAQLR